MRTRALLATGLAVAAASAGAPAPASAASCALAGSRTVRSTPFARVYYNRARRPFSCLSPTGRRHRPRLAGGPLLHARRREARPAADHQAHARLHVDRPGGSGRLRALRGHAHRPLQAPHEDRAADRHRSLGGGGAAADRERRGLAGLDPARRGLLLGLAVRSPRAQAPQRRRHDQADPLAAPPRHPRDLAPGRAATFREPDRAAAGSRSPRRAARGPCARQSSSESLPVRWSSSASRISRYFASLAASSSSRSARVPAPRRAPARPRAAGRDRPRARRPPARGGPAATSTVSATLGAAELARDARRVAGGDAAARARARRRPQRDQPAGEHDQRADPDPA